MQSKSREPAPVPADDFVPLCVPNIGGREWEYVKDCLDTGWVSSVGSYVERLERTFAGWVGADHAVATGSGTAALHVAMLLAGVQPGDEVVVPSLTFIAPANVVRYVGAWPTFVDVDPNHWQLDVTELAAFLREDCRRVLGELRNRHTDRRVVAVQAVDILGHPCDLDAIHGLAREYGLGIVEDATESLGAEYRGRRLGRGTRLTCFSFNGNKVITTGGGGMLVTDDEALARRARYLTTQAKDDPMEFVHREVGYNYRLSNVQAAMGCAQLERLEEFVERKRQVASRYSQELSDIPGITPMREAPWARASYWLFSVLVDAAQCRLDSRSLMRRLEEARIETRPLWQPLHRSPAHRGSFARACPVAEQLNRQALSLPSSTSLTPEQQARVISTVRQLIPAPVPNPAR